MWIKWEVQTVFSTLVQTCTSECYLCDFRLITYLSVAQNVICKYKNKAFLVGYGVLIQVKNVLSLFSQTQNTFIFLTNSNKHNNNEHPVFSEEGRVNSATGTSCFFGQVCKPVYEPWFPSLTNRATNWSNYANKKTKCSDSYSWLITINFQTIKAIFQIS